MSDWKKRLEEVAKIQADKADVIENEIRKQYEKALASIAEQIELFYARYAKTNDISMAEARKLLDKSELNGFKMSLDEFKEKALDNADGKWTALLDSEYIKSRVSRLEALKCQIRSEIELLKQKQERSFTELLSDTYSDTFYRHMFEHTREIGFEVDFTGLDTTSVQKAVCTKWLDDNNFSDRIWRDKEKLLRELNTNLVQGIIRGDSPDKMITALSKRMKVSRNYAAALVQTESAYIMNEAAFDTYKVLGVDEYEIVETLDSHTCKTCGDMDGKHIKSSEKEPGVNCPPFHTGCRGFTMPYFNDEFTVNEKRAARDENGRVYYIDGNISYKKWRENVDKHKENGIIKVGSGSVALENQRYGRNKDTLVNKTYIESGEYKRKFDNISENKAVNKTLYDCAKAALKHRSGTKFEDMYWIDGNTGEIIVSALNEKNESGVVDSKRRNKILTQYENIYAIHTHPASMPPSATDFNCFFEQGYSKAIVACHDGTLYSYTSEQLVSKGLYDIYISSFVSEGYSEKEAQLKALEKLKENHKIDFWEVV